VDCLLKNENWMDEVKNLISCKYFQDIDKNKLSIKQKEELWNILEVCKKNDWNKYSLFPLLYKMIIYEVPLPWVDRIIKSKTIFKNDSSSLKSMESRYGEALGLRFFKEKNQKSSINKQDYIKKYGEESWKNLCKSKACTSLISKIEKYGEEEGKKRQEQYLKKWRKSIKNKGGWDNGLKLEDLIKNHGEEEGYMIWKNRRENQRKRFTKNWYIKKYGEKDGEKEWRKYKKHMKEMSYKGARLSSTTYSKISQKLFKKIVELSKIEENLVKYASLNKEKRFKFKEYSELGGGYYFMVDFIYKNKIIEFDGEYWHKKDKIKNKDKIKTLILISKGYEVLRIKEKEYKEYPVEILKKCIAFILKGEVNEQT